MLLLIFWFVLCFPVGLVLGLSDLVIARKLPRFRRIHRLAVLFVALSAFSVQVSTYEIIRVPMLPKGEDFAICLLANGVLCICVAERLLGRFKGVGGDDFP
jgi:hypothetical protein